MRENKTKNQPKYITVKDLERDYSIGRGAFYGMVKNGLKTIKMPGVRGKILVSRSELEKYLKRHER